MARRVSETIIFVEDMDEALQFYTGCVGFTLEKRNDWGFTVLKMDDKTRLGLMLASAWDREYPDDDQLPKARVALQTDDFEGEIAKLRRSAVEIGTIKGEPGGRQAVTFTDPDGNPFFLWTDPEESMAEA